MIIEEITVTAFQQHTRIVGCEQTKRAICIDPGDGSDEIVLQTTFGAVLLVAGISQRLQVSAGKGAFQRSQIIMYSTNGVRILEAGFGDSGVALRRAARLRPNELFPVRPSLKTNSMSVRGVDYSPR